MNGEDVLTVSLMMTREFAEQYFRWLSAQIVVKQRGTPKTFDGLFRILHSRDFVWIIPNDDNRVADALDLRREIWGEGNQIPRSGVSTLEVLVALSRRLAFNAGGDREHWAGQLIRNLGLHKMYDPLTKRKSMQIEDTLEALIWRTYDADGTGGFFPLARMEDDQTQVEIWYQMSAYINEHSVM